MMPITSHDSIIKKHDSLSLHNKGGQTHYYNYLTYFLSGPSWYDELINFVQL